MTSQIEKFLTIGFCALWALFIFLDYWYFHPEYGLSIKVFKYVDLGIALLVIGGAVGYGLLYQIKKNEKLAYLTNGLGLLAFFLLISGLTIYFHFFKIGGNFTISFGEILTYLGKLIAVLAAVYFVYLTTFSIGDLAFRKLFSFSFPKGDNALMKIATGVSLLSVLLFLLGSVKLLVMELIFPLFLLIIGINWKSNLQFAKTTLVQPSKNIHQLNWLGYGSLFLFLIFISLACLQNIRPYPFGFDALALYLNLPNLIKQSNGLVEAYSPYYWSLFISLGHILFNRLEVVIALSVSGGVLSVLFIYQICRKWLNMNHALMTATLLYSLPLINFQSYRDIKTDLGLLFILLAVVLALIRWLSLEDESAFRYKVDTIVNPVKNKKGKFKKKKTPETVAKIAESSTGLLGKYLSEKTQLIILVGILSGMAMGIKLTGLIIIFGVLGALAYIKGGPIGFLTAFVFSFAVILLGGLDVTSGLRAYHFSAEKLKLIVPIIGLIGVGYLFIKNRKATFDLMRITTIYGVVALLVYLPWPLKNYQETKRLSIDTFIVGKPNNKWMDLGEIMRNAQEIEAQQRNAPQQN